MENTDCLKVVILGLELNGIWEPESVQRSAFLKRLFTIYFIAFQLSVYIPLLLFQIVHIFMVVGDLLETMNIGMLLAVHIIIAPKTFTIWYEQDKIRQLLHLIDVEILSHVEPDKKALLAKVARLTYVFSIYFQSLIVLTAGFWAILPFLRPIPKLPLEYPYVEVSDPKFPILFAYQIFTIAAVGIGAGSADTLMAGILALASGGMDILYLELQLIGMEDGDVDGGEDDNRMISRRSIEEREERRYQEVIRCIKFHNVLINLIKDFEDIFSVPTLLQFLFASISICGTTFRISISKEPLETITLCMYLCGVITESLLFCFFGDLVREKSEKISEGANFSNWTEMSPRVRRLILLLMLRSQRPIVFSAGNVFDVTLTTFAAILRTSYSYFTVLTQRANES